jgi:hypothetical protein
VARAWFLIASTVINGFGFRFRLEAFRHHFSGGFKPRIHAFSGQFDFRKCLKWEGKIKESG